MIYEQCINICKDSSPQLKALKEINHVLRGMLNCEADKRHAVFLLGVEFEESEAVMIVESALPT